MKYLAVLIFLFTSFVSSSQNNLNGVEGVWIGEGNLFGREAKFEMIWEIVLQDKFLKLTFSNEFLDKTGNSRSLKSEAYYKIIGDDDLIGYWFDSRGLILPLKGSFLNSKLTIFWGDKDTERGKTIYSINENNTIDVEDYVSVNDEFKLFGKASYIRK